MIRNAIFTFLGVFLLASPASSSGVVGNNATNDGIGYRSNFIDPLNPYDANRYQLLWSLLKRYDLVPDHSGPNKYLRSYFQSLSSSEYITRVRKLLSSESNILEVEKYHYAYGICETNDFPSALAFMEAAVKELGSSPDTDKLISARHHLLELCNTKKSNLKSYLEVFNSTLLPLRKNKRYASWTDYLDGVVYFYEELFDQANEKFSSIEGDRYSWLKDTANYMAVRILKANTDSFRVPPSRAFHSNPKKYLENKNPAVVPILERALSNLENAVQRYLRLYPKGRYVETVQNLDRYANWLKGNHDALVATTHRDFSRIFAPNTDVSIKQKISFLTEAAGSTEAIFYMPKESGKDFSVHPLVIVSSLLSEISNEFPFEEKSPSNVWRSRLDNVKEVSKHFPGLSDYFDLLLLAHDQKFSDIAQQKITQEIFGPLYADALILQARALEQVGDHLDAANLWLETSIQYPLYNALTEAATAYVRAGKFEEFVKIKKSWLTDFAPAKVSKDKWLDDEFNIDVKSFYAIYQPYRNLLRRGFETMVSFEEAASVYSDVNLSPIIRFLAAEPTLRANLLRENYSAFIDTAKSVFDTNFDSTWSRSIGGEDAILVEAYRELVPKVETLTSNPDDPDSLTAVGYFLYSKHRFPKCYGELTLWESSFGKCEKGRLELYPTGHIRPIDLFLKALSIYKLQRKRSLGEAKVLRILVYCFKGYENTYNCSRDTEEAYPKSERKKFFQRLHKYFPKEAKRTPYWY